MRGVPDDAIELLKADFTHKNPAHFKLKSMNLPSYKEPAVIRTWRGAPGVILLPRGGTQRVREWAASIGREIWWHDERTCPDPDPNLFPPHQVKLYDYQERMVQAALDRENCIVRASTGCITGDAMISLNRGGKGFACKLSHVVRMQNGFRIHGKIWDPEIPTMVRAMKADGTIGLVKLAEAYESGVKPVFGLRLECGRTIEATADHRFWTMRGWRRLGQLEVGVDEVFIEENKRPQKTARKHKINYKLKVAKLHPHRARLGINKGKGAGTVVVHRLVAEAALNKLDYDEFIKRVNVGPINGLVFLGPEWVVHHKDENPKNNQLNNLAILTHAQHRQEHRDLYLANIAIRARPSKVECIEALGEKMTYDLSMAGPHNFVANGMVVHNSGKTCAAMAMLPRIGVPALVVVNNGALHEQWLERAEKDFGTTSREIGVVRAGKMRLRPLTIAMQQTLYKLPEEDRKVIASYFGALICDEVQGAAARTLQEVFEWMPAKYRIGVSASEQRKDRKEFLIYDMFGQVAIEVTRSELAARNFVHEVEVRAIETEADVAWYRHTSKANTQFGKLLDALTNDNTRDALAADIAAGEVRAGHQVLIFSHRRDHCARLSARMAGLGVPTGMMLGGPEDAAELERSANALRAGTMRCAVGTIQAIGTGIDLPSISRGVLATPIMANKQLFGQVTGRLCRSSQGKTDAILYYLHDGEAFGDYPLRNIRKWTPTVTWQDSTGAIMPIDERLARHAGHGDQVTLEQMLG